LRVKESDRLATMARGFGSLGMTVEETTDGLAITGTGGEPLPGGTEPIDPEMDHRIAMSFAVAGLHCRASLTIADMSPAGTSFPRFAETLEGLAA
jgi:3-phosphoshikimate 1-carboxyvinyltransferase